MRTNKINWPVSLFILGYHLFLLIALPIYFYYTTPSIALITASTGIVFLSGIAITAGYHRLYSHLTYKTHWVVESIFLFFSSVATQGSALRWAYDHRMHHAFVDTDKDPYTVKKGFMYAHLYWMLRKSNSIDPKVVADLLKNPLICFQDKHYVFCMLASNALVFLTIGWLLGDYVGAFIFAWWGRLLISHHTTWCINSLAHYWGSQNYSNEHTAVDNYIISLITYGEGYHNYHHSFANDYRNGIRWFHFDPGKWLIWTLSKVGLARDLKMVNNLRIKKQLVSQHTQKLLEALKSSINRGLEEKVTQLSSHLIEKLNSLQALYDKCKQIPKNEARILREQIRTTKREWKRNWREWKLLVKNVQKDHPIHH
jgi:stearoyl-CoA desaturase (delta-9 desaturase)